MRCPSCQNENDAGAAYCDMCGMDLAPPRPAPAAGSAPAPQPPQPANPHQKRHTVFEPGPTAPSPAPPAPPAQSPRGTDFFAQPPPPRPTFDPRDPFAAASIPPGRASVSPSIPRAPAAPVPPPGGPSPRPKAHTIVESGNEGASTALVRGALFEYRGPSDPGRVHPLRVGRNVVGRNADCDVVLEDGRVSGQHAFVFIRSEDASFIDVSSNGSVVNGSVVHGDQLVLQNQAVITLGGTTLVLVILPEQLLSRRSS